MDEEHNVATISSVDDFCDVLAIEMPSTMIEQAVDLLDQAKEAGVPMGDDITHELQLHAKFTVVSALTLLENYIAVICKSSANDEQIERTVDDVLEHINDHMKGTLRGEMLETRKHRLPN